jgi:hypothetical protein
MVSSGRKVWDWLSEEENQKTLKIIGVGFAALAVAFWAGSNYCHRPIKIMGR